MDKWEEKFKNTVGKDKEKRQLRIAIIFFILFISLLWTMALYGQTRDTIRGSITHVDYTNSDGVYITIENNATGELFGVLTSKYIREQKEFFIENGENVLPAPLHVTDLWMEDNVIYITTSEPTSVVLYLREKRWEGYTPTGEHNYWEWSSQAMTNSNGLVETHAYGIPLEFLGINWTWQLRVVAKNINGDEYQSEMIQFKTDGTMFKY
jgi:hypothetical protein